MIKKVITGVELLLFIALVGFIIFGGLNKTIIINDLTPEIQTINQDILDAVVYIESPLGWSGSGVIIGDHTMLTAAHMFEGNTDILIYPTDIGNDFIYTDEAILYDFDAAIIVTDMELGLPAIPIGDSNELKIGDTIYIIGYPYATNTDIVTKGIVSALAVDCYGFFGYIDMIVVDAASCPGNSGGAVINEYGELIGILVGGRGYGDNYSIVVPINLLELEEIK